MLFTAVKSNEFPHRVIKNGPEVVDCIPSDQPNISRGLFRAINIGQGRTGVRITLGPEFIWVVLDESSERSPQIRDVMLGPF